MRTCQGLEDIGGECVWVEAWLQTTIVPSMSLSQLMIAPCVVLYSTILLRSRLNDELL